jgi:hypothetical protein
MTIPADGEHDSAANIFGLLDAAYTDNGGLTSHGIKTLQPRHRQGEHFGTTSGVQVATHAGAEGGATAGFINNDDWIAFTPYNLANAARFTARVASAGAGGTIEVRAGSATGTLLGTATVANTGGWENYVNVSAALTTPPTASTALYLVFKGGTGNLFDVDAFTLDTVGAVGLRSRANNLYVTAGTGNLIANSATAGAAQRFERINLGGGVIALRAMVNTMYVCADNAGANPLIANRPSAGAWERFALVTNSDGSISLRATINSKYVVAENAGAAALIANRDTIGAWEKFDLVTL